MVAITSLDVAFITAMAAVAAAIAAPASAWLVARTNNKHDRWVKTYGDLHDAYSGLLQDYIGARSALLRLARAYETNDPGSFVTQGDLDEGARIERLADVNCLASRRVADAIEAWDTAWRNHVTPVVDSLSASAADDPAASATTLRESLRLVHDPWTRLREAIREDLRNQ
jgi:hypothetical protein